ncbi:MAG: hypothetical protein QF775_02280 [archaeon]|jgi:hypothetical protein|nr:hypothetical protein [Euryarchaeota archaeon]MDP6704289.1 hypothetical protein [archaeon]|tara:strand:- start:2787 stop:3578 length:792 start_codon:yes stop_codon:yes gene_type:complete
MALLKKKKNDYDPLEDTPPEKDKLKTKTAGADIESIKEEVGFPNTPVEEAPLEPMPPEPPIQPEPEASQAPFEAPPSETGQIPELTPPTQPAQAQEEDPLAFLGGAGEPEAPTTPEDTSSQALPTPPSELPQANIPQSEAPGVQEELPMAPATSSAPAYGTMVMNDADAVRREFETKLSLLKDEIQALKKLDEEIKGVVDSMDRIEQKYEKVEIRAEDNNTKLTETLDDVKSTVSAIDKIMSSALPALIKEVRSISEIKSKGK